MVGKVFISKSMGGELDIPIEIQQKTAIFYLTHFGYKPTVKDKTDMIE
ncbi:hypothetical protein ACSFC1_10000 [Pseudothermotoga sp. U03pept]